MTTTHRGFSLVPPWVLATGAMFTIQLSSALAVPLIGTVGPAGTAWLRTSAGAPILLLIAPPRGGRSAEPSFPCSGRCPHHRDRRHPPRPLATSHPGSWPLRSASGSCTRSSAGA